jgi:hypothetical protein
MKHHVGPGPKPVIELIADSQQRCRATDDSWSSGRRKYKAQAWFWKTNRKPVRDALTDRAHGGKIMTMKGHFSTLWSLRRSPPRKASLSRYTSMAGMVVSTILGELYKIFFDFTAFSNLGYHTV